MIFHQSILFSLNFCLVFIESSWIIHFLKHVSFLKLHFQLLHIEITSLLFLSFNKFFFSIIPIFDFSVIFPLFHALCIVTLWMWNCNFCCISLLRYFLIFFYLSLSLHLYIIVRPYATKTFVTIFDLINISFSVSNCLFELNWFFKFLIHHISLPFFSVWLSFNVFFIIGWILGNNKFINVFHFLIWGFLLLLVKTYHILKVVMHFNHFILSLLFFNVF